MANNSTPKHTWSITLVYCATPTFRTVYGTLEQAKTEASHMATRMASELQTPHYVCVGCQELKAHQELVFAGGRWS